MTPEEAIKIIQIAVADVEWNYLMNYSVAFETAIKALETVNRQQAEIERLKIENQSLRSAANSYKLHYNEAGTEAIKEFAKRLKNSIYINTNLIACQCEEVKSVIDDIVKEMVGDNK